MNFRNLLILPLFLLATIAPAATPCTNTYEGQFIAHWSDPAQFFLTCWPVQTTPSTTWRDINNQPVDPQTLDFDDTLRATGCFAPDGMTLVAEEVLLLTPPPTKAVSSVQAVFGVVSGPAWTVQTTTDLAFATPGVPNAPLTLFVGQRYTFSNSDGSHPFELIAADNALGNDTIVLAQGATAGSLEADPDVSWDDNGTDISFTVSNSLVTALNGTVAQQPGYRCGIHTTAMRGAINLQAPSAVEGWEVYH